MSTAPWATAVAVAALLAWCWLVTMRGRFWQRGPILAPARPLVAPPVDVVVPARDEAALIERSIASLLAQDYAGRLRIFLVDDASGDDTADRARAVRTGGPHRLEVIEAGSRPAGWAGKLWAVRQGVTASDAELLLLTDADIVHDPAHVATLVAHAERSGVALVSEMVALNCESVAERALIPAFVYFFALLYPFAWVNDPRRRIAAAAGGTVLIRRAALDRAGGFAAIRDALIDDVALARRVKPTSGAIWLGHSVLARSVRPYGWGDTYRMIARSAYVQLGCSPLLLAGTLLGLALLFVAPPLVTLFGHDATRAVGALAWVMMAISLVPTLRRFGLSPLRAPLLPLAACFYMAATVGSALDHHRGRGVRWKQRDYAESRA